VQVVHSCISTVDTLICLNILLLLLLLLLLLFAMKFISEYVQVYKGGTGKMSVFK